MPDLNCTEFEARLMRMVEDRESLDTFEDDADPQSARWQELRAQANQCLHCRKLWNEFALLERVLPAWKSQLPSVDLADRVIARWRVEQTANTSSTSASQPNGRKESTWRLPWAVVMGVAVAVLLAIRFAFPPPSDPNLTDSHLTSAPVDDPVLPNVDPGISENVTEPKADLQTLAQDAGTAYWALASDAADSFASVTVFVPPRKATAEIPAPEVPSTSSGWVEGIGSGLKPIGQDVKKSMGFLLDALPSDPSTI